jgi:DNA-binding NtrC family response regulator
VRQLRNVLEQALMRSERASIAASDLQGLLETPLPAASLPTCGVDSANTGIGGRLDGVEVPAMAGRGGAGWLRPLAEQVRELEQRAITQAMVACRGNRVAAARLLGISRATLYQRLASSVA